ncbi:hypothetical protein COU37_02400 [Candidatus Micrarchaeota archaeon CG10_big_fil_rev_8_21_14_0_10_45_29]|nr:MAG: hypothetical protein COU37_02400 [Candidatus Micrarchaeota archaeon CG10_big_fil_rev_8_21_14_0_10_45_29]
MASLQSFFLFSPKAQAATEYVILLSLVLIVSLIVISVTDFFPGFAYSSQTSASQKYWASASPIAIIDFTQSGSSFSAVIENRANANIQISAFVFSTKGTDYDAAPIPLLSPGEKYTISSLATTSCTGRKPLEYGVRITYATDEVSSLVQTGLKPIYLRCTD